MTMNDDRIAAAAQALAAARLAATPLDELPEAMRPATLAEGYGVQARLNAILSAERFGDIAGYKIGATTPTMQAYLGVDHPCAGVMFESTIHSGEARFARNDFCRPGVECEIAVTLGADLAPGATPLTLEEAAGAVRSAHASLELVDDRWTDFRAVSTPSLAAENFFGAGCVLGPPREIDPIGLDRLRGRMRVDGEEVGAGVGADILGHPLNALVWLAGLQAAAGRPLKAGDIVTLGSVVEVQWLKPRARVEMSFDELGGCALTLE